MISYSKKVEIRWSDLDPNYHLRHSVYYDWGAYCRICFLNDFGMTTLEMKKQNIGPIIFREEALFKKEVLPNDSIEIFVELVKCTKDYSRWTMQHKVVKNGDTLAAILTIDGAWLDTQLRKLTIPNAAFAESFSAMPKADGFVLIN